MLVGRPKVSVRELAPEDQDIKAGEWGNKTHHSYLNAAFYRTEFLVALLGGPSPVVSHPLRCRYCCARSSSIVACC